MTIPDGLNWAIKIAYMRIIGKERVALASFPRSGNTWLRYMIELATGKLSGSIYQDRVLPRSSDGIVIKTHELDSYRYTRAIHITRDPFSAIESYYHWKKDIAQDEQIDWDDHLELSVFEWQEHSEHWLQAKIPIYRVRYEDLHSDALRQLLSLLDWLGYKYDPKQLGAVIEAASLEKMRDTNPKIGSQFFRRGQVGKTSDLFTPEQRDFVNNTLHELLEIFGYAPVGVLFTKNPA